jgi:hypothetical protein
MFTSHTRVRAAGYCLAATLLIHLWPTGLSAQSSFIAGGVTYAVPSGSMADAFAPAPGTALTYGSRAFCNVWTGVRFAYTQLVAGDEAHENAVDYEVSLAPEVRYFPIDPMTFPGYLRGSIELSVVSAPHAGTPVGLGAGAGIGILFPYTSACCGWFLDLSAGYRAPNLIRDEDRSLLSAFVLGLSLNIGL